VPLILGRELVAWNAGFDQRALVQSSTLHALTLPKLTWHCAMSWGAQIWGKWSEYHGDFQWVNLVEACAAEGVRVDAKHHRAAGDAQRLSALMNAATRREAVESQT